MNESGLKSLDKIGADKRVASIKKDGTRVRIELNGGWVFTDLRDSIAYFDGIKDAWHAFRHNVSPNGSVTPEPKVQSRVEVEVIDSSTSSPGTPEFIDGVGVIDLEVEDTSGGRGFRAIDTPIRNSKWRCPACRTWTTDPMGKTCQACRTTLATQ